MTAPGPADAGTLLDAFAAVAERLGDHTAVRCGDQSLTYRELDAEACSLAAAIQAQTHDWHKPVAILLERSADMIVAALAVLKTGSCYVPLDPASPRTRLGLIINDTTPSLVVTAKALVGVLPADTATLLVDSPRPGAGGPVQTPRTEPQTRAYIIFTSGTTGRPKGVQVSHANLLWLLRATDRLFEFGPKEIWSMAHSFAFDFSVWEMWGALLHGGCVVVVPHEVARDTAAFRRLLREERVTVLSQTPTAFKAFIAEDSGHADRLPLKWVVFGGEALRFADLRRWTAKYGDDTPELVNMYGITETTVHASYRRVRQADLHRTESLIGHPLPGGTFHVVNEQLAAVDAGQVGEIVVTGPGVTIGYLGRPDLDKERFVQVTAAGGHSLRGYRTGDLARSNPSGEYEYLGRNDDQVKIRGFRIELGEVEAALHVPGVLQVTVIARKPRVIANPVVKQRSVSTQITMVRDLIRGGGQPESEQDAAPKLVAYVVLGDDFDADALFRSMRENLPPYMTPAFVIPVPDIPVNSNGKVDHAALPQPTAANCLRDRRPDPSERDDGEAADAGRVRIVCELFEEILGIDGVVPGDSFFRLGGDSILSLRLRAAAASHGLALELQDIYSLHTPLALAAACSGVGTAATGSIGPFSLILPEDREVLPAGIQDAYPVGMLQAGLLFHSAYDSAVNMYCDVFMFRLKAPCDHEAMAGAIAAAVRRHEVLRTSFHFSGYSEPLQLVHAEVAAPLSFIDLSGLGAAEQERELDAWRQQETRTAYDWSCPPLMRFFVHRLGPREFLFSMCFHDAVLDGWSEASLLTEILTGYWLRLRGEQPAAAPAPAPRYADFIAAEQTALRNEEIRKYWLENLAAAEPTVVPGLAAGDLPARQPRMGFLSVDIEPGLSRDLHELAIAQDVSLKHVLLAAHARVIAALNGREEVVLGVESNGRLEEEGGADVIGLHLNVVPYRLRTSGKTWTELIAGAAAKEEELLAVRRFPYAELLRVVSMRELTDINFNYTHFHGYEKLATATEIEILDAKGYNFTNLTLRVEFNVDPFSRLLTLDLEANMQRIAQTQLHRIAELYRNALADLAANPRRVPAQQALLGPGRWRELLAGFSGPSVPAAESSFFALFDRVVAAHGDKVAAVCGRDCVAYRELAARVDALAGLLSDRNVRYGTVVGLAADRDLSYLVALLAILRIGAVYLPLPSGPAFRVARMINRSQAKLILCDSASRPAAVAAADGDIDVIDLARTLTEARDHQPYRGPAPSGQDVAYVIFTSGSTGEPKGARVRHGGMLNHVLAKIDALGLGPADRVSQDAAATFDISMWQWLAPLAVGASTVIYPDDIGRDPSRLLRVVAEDAITILEVSPPVLSVMNAELAHRGTAAYPDFALRWVASQAEALTPRCANEFRRLLPGTRLLNMWGLTETSDDCTHHEVVGEADESAVTVPIGRPIRNVAVYVLDADRNPVPLGTPGELFVGGVCVAAGYLNDEARTSAAFVPDPLSGQPGATMYRTGDRGRQLADGAFEFLGRTDDQLRIRGNRIELGEVTHALSGLEVLQESAVVVRHEPDGGGRHLVGFFVPKAVADHDAGPAGPVPRLDVTAADVRAGLAKILPRHAIPDFLIRVDELPRTPHGKIDVRALADRDIGNVTPAPGERKGPATPTEAAVADTWTAVLRIRRPDPTADFFELGGHSLHATQVTSRLADRFAVDLPVRVLFEHPTVRQIAAWIDGRLGSNPVAPHGLDPIPRRRPGRREFPLAVGQASLWFLIQLDPGDRAYEYGNLLHLSGPLDLDALRFAVDAVAERHEILSMRFGSRDGIPFQTPVPAARVRLEVEAADAGPGASTDPEAMMAMVRQRCNQRRFDLGHGPVAVARLYRFSASEHILEWSTHHVVSDGWSNDVVVRDVRECYLAHIQGRQPDVPALPVQYADYAVWQQEFLANAKARAELSFWRAYLDGYPGILPLPTDTDRLEQRSRTAGYAATAWDAATSQQFRDFAQQQKVTLFMLFHAVAAVLMSRLSDQPDVVLGAAVAGRNVPGTENLVGFFANTLPFRYRVDRSSTPVDMLNTVRGSALTALEHQDVPFHEIVKVTGGPRRRDISPLVQVFVTVDQYPLDLSGLPGLTGSRERIRPATSQFDMLFEFVDAAELQLTVQYDSSLFRSATIERLLDDFCQLMSFFIHQTNSRLQEAPGFADSNDSAG
jgi:amino acid adenylation domain-containing protein